MPTYKNVAQLECNFVIASVKRKIREWVSGQGCLILRPFGGFKSAARAVSGEESEGRERGRSENAQK